MHSRETILVRQLLSKPISTDSTVLNHVRRALAVSYANPQNGYQVYQYLGDFCERENARLLAGRYYSKARYYLDKISGKPKQNAMLCKKIARNFQGTGNSDSASFYFKKSLQLFPDDPDSLDICFRISELEYQTAHYQEAYEYSSLVVKGTNERLSQQMLPVKGLILLQLKLVKPEELKGIYNRLPEPTNWGSRFCLKYAQWLLNKNFVLIAGEVLKKAETYPLQQSELKELLEIKVRYLETLMEKGKAQKLKDSIAAIELISKPTESTATTDVKWSELFEQQAVFESPKKETSYFSQKNLERMAWLALSILVLLSLILVVLRLIVAKRAEINASVALAEQPADDTVHIVDRSGLQVKEDMLEKLYSLQRLGTPEELSNGVTKLTLELEDVLHSERERTKILENVDHLFGKFYGQLEKTAPHLADREKELIGLIRLNHSVSEIADLWNISEGSVIQRMQAVKKQLSLSESEDLYIFIANL